MRRYLLATVLAIAVFVGAYVGAFLLCYAIIRVWDGGLEASEFRDCSVRVGGTVSLVVAIAATWLYLGIEQPSAGRDAKQARRWWHLSMDDLLDDDTA